MINKCIVAMLFITLGSTLAANPPHRRPVAQASATGSSLPTADQILDGYIQALGGKGALEKLASRTVKGITEWGDGYGTGTTEYYFKAPSRYMSISSLPGMGTSREGFNGDAGWSLNTTGVARDWVSHEIAAAKQYRNFYREVQLKALYPKIVVTRKERLGSRQVYVLELTPASGRPETMYFDTETRLLLMHEYEVEGPQGVRPFAYYYEDYRDVDGVKVAFKVRRLSPMPSYAFKASEVKHNIEIEDEKFNKPTAR